MSEILSTFFDVLGYIWWLLLFAILWPLFRSTWLFWRHAMFKAASPYTLLELRIPREVRKSAKAMEQFLTALHTLRNSPANPKEKWIAGEVTRWYSLEIVSFGGEVHYYVRVPTMQKALVEAPLFSYYPDVEVVEVDDYIDRLPTTTEDLQEQGYDMWGTEMVQVKPGAYPTKTYVDFEADVEERSFDPMGVFIEVLAKLKKEEIVGIQIIVVPMGDEWRKEGEEVVKELKAKSAAPAPSKEGEAAPRPMRTPGETDVIERVEKNIAKPGFESVIRFVYFSPKTSFDIGFAARGLMGAFNQYGSLNLNKFRPNMLMAAKASPWKFPFIFPSRRTELRRARLLYNYRHRKIPWHTFMGKLVTSFPLNSNFNSQFTTMSTEVAATLFHPPAFTVTTAPHIKRVESRKVGPPAGLPIYGEEGELERFT